MTTYQSPLRRSTGHTAPTDVQRIMHFISQHPSASVADAVQSIQTEQHRTLAQQDVSKANELHTSALRAEKNIRMGASGWND